MSQPLFLMGIDHGTSRIKCAVFDPEGRELAAAFAAPPASGPAPGFCQRDPDAVWKKTCEVIQSAIARAGISSRQIAGVSLCGYGGGLVLTDRDGQAVFPVILSSDTRARQQLQALRDDGRADQIFSVTHQRLWEGQAAPLLSWFREQAPSALAKARFALPVKDWLRARLTGAVALERTDASNLNLIDPRTGTFSDALFSLTCRGGERLLFDVPLLDSAAQAGRISRLAARETGLLEGTPVAAGLYDVSACTLGCGALSPRTPAVTNGTWSMASCFSSSFERADESTIVTVSALPGTFLLEQGSPTGTINLDWYLDQILQRMAPSMSRRQLYGLCARAAESYRGRTREDEAPFFVPFLFGDSEGKNRTGAFLNLCGDCRQEDLLYAVLEGILLATRCHVRLLEKGGLPFTGAFLAGGFTGSRPTAQMLCDMLQIPLTISDGSQQGARGAAMCAGIVSGRFQDLEQAARAMARPAGVLSPHPGYRDYFQIRAALYRQALAALSVFHEKPAPSII